MSAPDTNGAPFLDGKYDLATMFGSTSVFTVLDPMGYPTPEEYKKLCFANVYTGQKLDEVPLSLFPTWTLPAGKIPNIYSYLLFVLLALGTTTLTSYLLEFGGGPIYDVNTAPFITPEMYCNVKWGAIDQAYWDLKICALKTIGEPVNMTKEEMLAIYDAAKKNMMDCSEVMCSAAVSDAAEDVGEQEVGVEASTKSSDASVNSFVGTIAAVALIALYLN